MLFNSGIFLLFFPIVVLGYFLLPKKAKNFWLLVSSYYFYMSWNAVYGLLLLGCTAVTFFAAVGIENIREAEKRRAARRAARKKTEDTAPAAGNTASGREASAKSTAKRLFILSLVIVFGALVYFKYTSFLLDNLGHLLGLMHLQSSLPHPDIVLPVGISFFTFQAAGYLIDVYRGDTRAERNFFRYALFVSFFPQLVAGPIERSKNLLRQLSRTYSFSFTRLRDGLFLMLWGYFLKMVIADRAAIFVDSIYNNYAEHGGGAIVLATVLFAFQIYGDFGGYSLIAIGAAKILGLDLMQNFDSPYFADGTADFWRRWHISLNGWFRDYVYIPLGGSRSGTLKRYRNILIVFLISGLWHGARWSFVVWGGLNGLYQIIGSLTTPARKRAKAYLRIDETRASHRILKILGTFVLVDFAWLFFRANGLRDAAQMIRKVFTDFRVTEIWGEGILNFGLNLPSLWVLVAALLLLMAVDYAHTRGIVIRHWVFRQGWWLREAVLLAAVFVILIAGVWGGTYDAQGFIYFQF